VVSGRVKIFAECDGPHTCLFATRDMRPAIARFHNLGEFAVTSRKSTFVRWAEEAEAKQVCEWAGLEQACDPPDAGTERSHGSRERSPFLRRLRGMFGGQTAQIERDG
jgi:hypothetical protein